MVKVAKNNNANIIELVAVLKKRLCSTWKSDALDQQAIEELKSAISKKKAHLNQKEKSDLNKILSDFENWVYEVDLEKPDIEHAIPFSTTTSFFDYKPNTQTI